MFGVGGNKNASQMVAQFLIGGITGKEGVVRVECSLGACCSINGVFPSPVAKEARDPAALLCFLLVWMSTGRQQPIRSGCFWRGLCNSTRPFYLFRSPGQHRIVDC